MKHYMNEYHHAMDNLQLSDKQQETLFRAAVHQADQKTKHRPVHRTAIAGVILASVLALTACGIALKTASEAFAPVFGNSTSQKAVIEKIGTQIGASATDNGVTITADAVIGDDHQAWIMYTLSWDNSANIHLPEGIPQSPEEYSTEIPNTVLQFEQPVMSYQSFFDSNPNDNTIEFMEIIDIRDTSTETLDIHSLTRDFQNLQFSNTDEYGFPLGNNADKDTESWQTIVNGHWKLEFDASYESAAVSIPIKGNESFERNGYTCEITSLTVSPISAFVEYTYTRIDADEPIISDEYGTHDKTYDCIENVYSDFYITTTSGQTYHTDATWGNNRFWADSNSYSLSGGGSFTKIIPLDEIESVTVGNVTYPVPHTAS